MTFKNLCAELEEQITEAYTSATSPLEAEKLAARFLTAQMRVSDELRKADLDSRMRKSGLKAVKAAVYMEACSKADKKPSDVLLEHTINMHELVAKEQDGLDEAEVTRDDLERYFRIFESAHVYFRNVAKGGFNG